MSATTNTLPFHQRFAAAFDAPCLSKRARVIALIIAGSLALTWLSYLDYLFLQPVLGGKVVPQGQWLNRMYSAASLINSAIFAFAVGLIGSRGLRRCRWLAGPALILLVAPLITAGALFISRPGLPAIGASGKIEVMNFQWGFNTLMLGHFGGALICAILGGLLAPAIFRRVRASILTAAAFAWALAGAAGLLLTYSFFSPMLDEGQTGGEIRNYLYFLHRTLPVFLGGLWLGWSLRENHPWAPASVLGMMALYSAILAIRIGDSRLWVSILGYEPRILMPLISALVGAWLGVLIAGGRTRRELLRPGLVIVGLIVLHILANQIILRFAF